MWIFFFQFDAKSSGRRTHRRLMKRCLMRFASVREKAAPELRLTTDCSMSTELENDILALNLIFVLIFEQFMHANVSV